MQRGDNSWDRDLAVDDGLRALDALLVKLPKYLSNRRRRKAYRG
jgi:hypothetical protein